MPRSKLYHQNSSRRHDATGRSTGRLAGRAAKLNSPPQGEPWFWITRELVSSSAWRALSHNGRRLIDRILVEHMDQGGVENGNLVVTYNDLEAWGIRRNSIAPAIAEAVVLGLLDIEPGRPSHISGSGHPNRFRIGWLPTADGEPATTRWHGFHTLADAKRAADQAKVRGADGRQAAAKRAPLSQNIEGSSSRGTGASVSPARLWKQ